MTARIYEDEYNPGWICKAFMKKEGDTVPCRRPRGHGGEHQNSKIGWKWWYYDDGYMKAIRIPTTGEK